MHQLPPVDAVALRTPLAPWKFPNGAVCSVRESDGFIEQMIEDSARTQNADQFKGVWRLLVPDASDAEWLSMTTEDYGNLLKHVRQKVVAVLKFVEDSRKNADGGTPGQTTEPIPPSNPTDASSPPSPESPEPSGETGPSSA